MSLILFIFLSLWSHAEEPGYWQLDLPPPSKAQPKLPQMQPPRAPSRRLDELFLHARGLKKYEFETLHYNRVACSRRVFTGNGVSVEGDGDLKVTQISSGLYEMEFVMYVNFDSFGAINPFRNDVATIQSITQRRLFMRDNFTDGQALKLSFPLEIHYNEEGKAPATTEGNFEFRVLDGTYPSTYLARQTVGTDKQFQLFYLCQ